LRTKRGNPDLEAVAEIIFSSGARISEAVNLRWSWIGFKDQCAYLPRSKNNDAKALPLIGRALTLLKVRHKRRDPENDLVFPSPVNSTQPRNFQNAWNVVRKRTNMTAKARGFISPDIRRPQT
jgi:integrase